MSDIPKLDGLSLKELSKLANERMRRTAAEMIAKPISVLSLSPAEYEEAKRAICQPVRRTATPAVAYDFDARSASQTDYAKARKAVTGRN